MQVLRNGIDLTTGAPLAGDAEEEALGASLLGSLREEVARIQRLAGAAQIATHFREQVRERTPDPADPREAGWTYLIDPHCPGIQDYVQALSGLAEHRGMAHGATALLFEGQGEDEWADWLQDNLENPDRGPAPHYILIVGGADRVPFHFQSLLQTAAAVGRVDFETPEALAAYAERLVRLETADAPAVEREAIFFAPDAGPNDSTYYSRRYMAEPLAERTQTSGGLAVTCFLGRAAQRGALSTTLAAGRPALVYTASHGVAALTEPEETQRAFNGAICCHPATPSDGVRARLLAAADIPFDIPFLEGAVFFQFACFGYGTPAESDFAHWLGTPRGNAGPEFVSALPKTLLAHPRGPIAYVGHVDSAWMHGFIADPDNPEVAGRWDKRIYPFVVALDALLALNPVGQAMTSMSERYDRENEWLTNRYDRVRRGKLQDTPEFRRELANRWIARGDAQNYMVYGDPGAALRLPARVA